MEKFSRLLLQWHIDNPRDLPWKKNRNPYHIWLSEIILQQTRVEQGTPYFNKFIKNYPKVEDLALASEQSVMKDWEGLGYYSRARNLHASAKLIHQDYQGIFPSSYKEILNLKGVGPYTAAAIASFAFDLPHAVLDGNVFRVLSRIFGIHTPIDSTEGKKEFQALADKLLDAERAADYNQAIMNFGATHCKPKNPKCNTCPFVDDCIAYKNNTIQELPLKKKKLAKKERFFQYLIVKSGDEILIRQRREKDIWRQLFEFPKLETKDNLPVAKIVEQFQNEGLNFENEDIIYLGNKKQILSHQVIRANFFLIELKKEKSHSIFEDCEKVLQEELTNFAFPVIIKELVQSNFSQGSFLF